MKTTYRHAKIKKSVLFYLCAKKMKIVKISVLLIFLFASVQSTLAQELKGSWKGGINTKLTMRSGEMEFTADKKGIKTLYMETSFYFYDTQNYHECYVDLARGDHDSKWTTKGSVTKVVDENETTVTKTRNGFVIISGCYNTQFYKVAFRRRGNRYVGQEIK